MSRAGSTGQRVFPKVARRVKPVWLERSVLSWVLFQSTSWSLFIPTRSWASTPKGFSVIVGGAAGTGPGVAGPAANAGLANNEATDITPTISEFLIEPPGGRPTRPSVPRPRDGDEGRGGYAAARCPVTSSLPAPEWAPSPAP